MCQAVLKEMWMDVRREDILEAPYFHVVFTVPEELNPVILSNQKALYDTLYHASAATIDELASDSKHPGAKVGYISILHTWGFEMNFHPHIHMILLGSGLNAKNEWKDNQLLFHGSAEKYRNLLGCKKYLSRLRDRDMPEKLKIFYGVNICICKSCGGHMGASRQMIPMRC